VGNNIFFGNFTAFKKPFKDSANPSYPHIKRKNTRCEGKKAQMPLSGEKIVIRGVFEGFFKCQKKLFPTCRGLFMCRELFCMSGAFYKFAAFPLPNAVHYLDPHLLAIDRLASS